MTISVILPVLDEADIINGAVGRLRSQHTNGPLEIIVVDGDPGGGTISAVEDRGVRTITAERGRAPQMNAGAALARGEVLLFLHADTRLPANAFRKIREALAAGDCIAGCFDLGIDSARSIFRLTEKYVALRTRLTRVPFGDQAIFIRRGPFLGMGGYREIPIMEDVELMARLKDRGAALAIIPEKVSTSARRWEKEGIFCSTARNWALQLCYAWGVRPERLAQWYQPNPNKPAPNPPRSHEDAK